LHVNFAPGFAARAAEIISMVGNRTDETDRIDALNFEQRKYRDKRRRLKLIELKLRRDELNLRNRDNKGKGFSFTSAQATILVALIGAVSATAGAAVTAYVTRDTEGQKSQALVNVEKLKVESDLRLEERKQVAAAALARSEFETKLIFRAIEGASEEERTRNLLFFLKAGFISDPDRKIASLTPSQFPSKASPTAIAGDFRLATNSKDGPKFFSIPFYKADGQAGNIRCNAAYPNSLAKNRINVRINDSKEIHSYYPAEGARQVEWEIRLPRENRDLWSEGSDGPQDSPYQKVVFYVDDANAFEGAISVQCYVVLVSPDAR
jgi:hypothetical protein